MFCKKCGKEVHEQAIICPNCGISLKEEKAKKTILKKWWFWLIIVIILIAIITGSSSSGNTTTAPTDNNDTVQSDVAVQNKTPAEFAATCPISVSASIADNIIGVPELSCNIKNNTEKDIAAIQFYFMPKDVYGNDINTIFTQNKLYSDTPIGAKASCTRSWQMLDDEVKSGDVYIYSVYFTDGTEWGNKDAPTAKIKKYGMKVSAES